MSYESMVAIGLVCAISILLGVLFGCQVPLKSPDWAGTVRVEVQ